MNIVNDKVAKLDADLLEMSLHLEEIFYPHLLNITSGRSSLEDVIAYNSSAKADYAFALQRLCEVDLPLLSELKSHKDASIADVMYLLRLEGPLADAPGMSDLQPHVDQLILLVHRSEDQMVLRETSLSFSLNVTHSRVERIRENVAAKRSALIGVWTPLVDPLSVENLIGEADTSDSMPVTAATTTALSVIFAFASTVPPITIEDYKIMGTDGPEDAKGSGQAEAASFPNTVEFEKEELDTTSDRDRTSWTILVTAPTCFSLLFLCTAAVCGLFVAVFVLLD
nr:hypothetical protein [Tanacetum cinerariifolium]